MEDFMRFTSYYKRPGANKKPCFVTAEIYDLVTEGDTSKPLFWKDNVPVIDNDRKAVALEILGSIAQYEPVIIR